MKRQCKVKVIIILIGCGISNQGKDAGETTGRPVNLYLMLRGTMTLIGTVIYYRYACRFGKRSDVRHMHDLFVPLFDIMISNPQKRYTQTLHRKKNLSQYKKDYLLQCTT